MKSENTAVKNADARETRAERAIRLLQTTATDPLQLKLQEFRVFYPAVAAARHKGMRTKQILKLLAEGGLKLYPALLEKLMVAMEQAVSAPTCQHCGQRLRINAVEPVPDSHCRETEGEHAPEPMPSRVEEALALHA